MLYFNFPVFTFDILKCYISFCDFPSSCTFHCFFFFLKFVHFELKNHCITLLPHSLSLPSPRSSLLNGKVLLHYYCYMCMCVPTCMYNYINTACSFPFWCLCVSSLKSDLFYRTNIRGSTLRKLILSFSVVLNCHWFFV